MERRIIKNRKMIYFFAEITKIRLWGEHGQNKQTDYFGRVDFIGEKYKSSHFEKLFVFLGTPRGEKLGRVDFGK